MGSAMLRKPRALAKMVAGIAADSELPVTVKVGGLDLAAAAGAGAVVLRCVGALDRRLLAGWLVWG